MAKQVSGGELCLAGETILGEFPAFQIIVYVFMDVDLFFIGQFQYAMALSDLLMEAAWKSVLVATGRLSEVSANPYPLAHSTL